jgi:hypothetical protein
MPLLRRRSSGDVHWSKDYIEHLRAVHFVLVVVAVTCIAVSRAPNIKQLQTAAHQCHVVIDFLNEQIKKVQIRNHARFIDDISDDVVEPWITFNYEGKTYFALEPELRTYFISCRVTDQDHRIDEALWLVRLNSGRLSTFIETWNDYQCGKKLSFDVQDYSTVLAFPEQLPVQRVRGTKITLRAKRYEQTDFTSEGRVNLSPGADLEKRIKFIEIEHPDYLPTEKLQLELMYAPVGQSGAKVGIWAHGYDRPLPRSDYGWLLPPDLQCLEPFDECFRELDQLTEDKREYKLTDIATFLDSEVKGQTREFEVFGIKFPTEDLSRWGIVLILAILAYFCLHLRELSPQITSTDTGLEVAWLGLYSSWYSYGLFWFSVLALPLTSILFLGVSGAKLQWSFRAANRWHWSAWVIIPSIVCCVLAVLSCLEARRLALLAETARRNDVPDDFPC